MLILILRMAFLSVLVLDAPLLLPQNTAYRLFLKSLYAQFDVEHISADSLKILMEVSPPVLLDIRSTGEFQVSHVRGARFVDYESFDTAMVADIDKNSTIVVYCSVGYRSSVVAEKLKASGYVNVRNLFGGIFAWVNNGNPLYRGELPTDEIHPYNDFWGLWLTKGTRKK